MTLAETLLERLADWRPSGREQSLHLGEDPAGWTVTLSADRCDQLGCLVWELTLRRPAAVTAGDSVRTWSERTVQRTTGLLEPLRLLEVDTLRDQALLRSQAPTQRGQDLLYYELVLTGTNEALLRRYRVGHAGLDRREQVGFALTHEALAKLVGDLTANR